MISEEEITEVGVEEKHEEEEEAEEEKVEVVLDQLKLLLDVTKIWRRILRNETSIEELKSTAPVKPAKKAVKPKAREKPEKKKTTGAKKTAKRKSHKKPSRKAK